MIGIADYGAGNIGSVMNMLKRLSIPAVRASTPDALKQAKALILPGVGAFDFCMSAFNASGLRAVLEELVLGEKRPLLGICVGHQMLFRGSEEGHEPGLAWIGGEVVRFDKARIGPSIKIPHMGWNDVEARADAALFKNIASPRFYFAHSFHAVPEDAGDILATATYGYPFCCSVNRGNISGVQFHPEKSHKYGMQLLGNFGTLAGVR